MALETSIASATRPFRAPEIDIIDPGVYERGGIPHQQFAWLRDNDPVHWHQDPNEGVPGFWAVTRHEDVVQVSRRADPFSSRERTSMFEEFTDDDIALYGQMMLFQDPPDHTRLRAMVNKGFTPRMIGRLQDHIREICHRLIDEAAPLGECDFVEYFAAPLPLYTICELLGAPLEDRKKIFHWSNKLVAFNDPDYIGDRTESQLCAAEFAGWAGELASSRASTPRDDIVTKLLTPDADGSRITDEEFQLFVIMLSIAGNETTRTATAGGMQAFFEFPDQWERLKADRSLLPTAVEEIVRWVSPINQFRRTALTDVELGGKQIRAGDKVVLFYGSANRDERVFDDPFKFDVGRDPNPHIGFGGGGPHFCLGTHLARMNLKIIFETILDRMPDIRPAGEPRRLRSNFVNGLKELPVRFTPS
ncbi:cytochrome P450 [Actinomadura livida]|uniref:Cholest-4-en-3-one 26-monooxygenase n=1 Tax=Actinomadura livida TaxID=79909 RepID=A0A7W7MZM4_9ACTN|nr:MULTISPECIES: cytochrome P450 [Actinomadura]MBB4777096.1 cholest-4-en-3-one 26-monooxygenase [Actinomadura catellatispora]GGU21739.1 steroid C26-monooxygenase [Actinomadura livida]